MRELFAYLEMALEKKDFYTIRSVGMSNDCILSFTF